MNSQILDLSLFIPQPFLLPKILHSSLSVLFVSLFNCSRQCISKSFTQKLTLGKGFGYTVPERTFRDAYAIRGTCPQEGAMYFSGQYIYLHSRESRFQMVLLSGGDRFSLPTKYSFSWILTTESILVLAACSMEGYSIRH